MLVASVLLSVSSLCGSEKTTKVCVIPTENSMCNCSDPCHTFDYYLSHPGSVLYQSDLLTMEFLPGTHIVKDTFSSWNFVGLYLIGRSDVTIQIDTDIESWFSLSESLNIYFTNLNFELISKKDVAKCELHNLYLFHFEDSSNVVFSQVNLTNPCGGGVYIKGKTEANFTFVKFDTLLHGLNLLETDGNVHVSNSILNGRMEYSLMIVKYAQLHNASLQIDHCEFYNGSGSLELIAGTSGYMPGSELSIKVSHVVCTTPKGGDFTLDILGYSGTDYVSIEISLDNLQLLRAMTYGVFLNFATFSGTYNVKINNSRVYFHNEGAFRMYNGNNADSVVSITNVVIENNQAHPLLFPVTGMLIKGTLNSALNPVTVMKNVTFISNSYVASTTADTVVTMMLFFVHNIIFVDCHFVNNTGTALYLENSVISAGETLTFINNTAPNGAAIFISGSSVIQTDSTSVLLFRNNRAFHNGGAIYIDYGINHAIYTLDRNDNEPCFVLVDNDKHTALDSTYILHFEGNVANDGGNDIFGGSLDQTLLEDGTKCITLINEISKINSSSSAVSAVSSQPSRVF